MSCASQLENDRILSQKYLKSLRLFHRFEPSHLGLSQSASLDVSFRLGYSCLYRGYALRFKYLSAWLEITV